MASSPMKKSRSSTPRDKFDPTLADSFTAMALGMINWGSLLPAYPSFEYLKLKKTKTLYNMNGGRRAFWMFRLKQKQTPRLNGIVKTTKLFHNWSQFCVDYENNSES